MAWENVKDSIKSCFQSSSHQNLLKFDTRIHCIMYINMLKIIFFFFVLGSVSNICRVRYLSDAPRYA